MFNQDLTIINRTVVNRVPSYNISHVKGFVSASKSVSLNGVDLVRGNGVSIYILMNEPGYVAPNQYNGNGWTLKNDDYIAKGIIETFTPSTPNAYKITSVSVKDYGSKNMQHFEVSAE